MKGVLFLLSFQKVKIKGMSYVLGEHKLAWMTGNGIHFDNKVSSQSFSQAYVYNNNNDDKLDLVSAGTLVPLELIFMSTIVQHRLV